MDVENGFKEGKLVGGQDPPPRGITVKVQAGGDGDLHWAAALGVERKRQLCNVFSGLT